MTALANMRITTSSFMYALQRHDENARVNYHNEIILSKTGTTSSLALKS